MWDEDTVLTFRVLSLACETGTMLHAGGLADQPAWFIELMSWFAVVYDKHKFFSKVRAVMGGTGKQTGKGENKRGSSSRGLSGQRSSR